MAQTTEGHQTKAGGNQDGPKMPMFENANPNCPYTDPEAANADAHLLAIQAKAEQELADFMAKGRGRPSTYSPDLALKICEHIADGMTMRQVCRMDGMPDTITLHRWLTYSKEFSNAFARASQLKLLGMADEIIDIADDSTNDWMERERKDGSIELVPNNEVVNRSRLRIDTRRWLLAKLMPTQFGDKVLLDVTSNYAELMAAARARVRERKQVETAHFKAIEGELVPLPEPVTDDDIAADAADHE